MAGDDDPIPVADRPTSQWVFAAVEPDELLATGLRERDGLRVDIDVDHARDVVWMANAPEQYALTVKRGWPTDRDVALVADVLLALTTSPQATTSA